MKKKRPKFVYEISCLDCKSENIGQIKSQLKTRVNKHKRDVKTVEPKSEIARHAKTGHKMRLQYEYEGTLNRIAHD